MKESGLIDVESFSYYMSDDESKLSSEIIFGGYAEEYIDSDAKGWSVLDIIDKRGFMVKVN